jgi:predicted acetylornithine/succinylornithine family transaminase
MSNQTLRDRGLRTLFPYRPSLVFTKGKGTRLWDADGRSYLDFLAGIAVNVLGHAHPVYLERVRQQLGTLTQVSNLYLNEPQILLAEALVERTFADRVYFCNSGAESVETALKLARRYQRKVVGVDRFEVIAMKQSFHGRTFGALSATGQPRYHEGFEPLIPGFHHAAFNDLAEVTAKVSGKTAAIIVEPIQGEGGVIPAERSFLTGLRSLCDAEGILLIFDEVQTGVGRTGTFLAHEQYEVEPDIVCLAKGLGGGLPLGATLCREDVAQGLVPGTHATTFGGNPVVMAGGLAVLEVIDNENLLARAKTAGARLRAGLENLASVNEQLGEVRGKGLMLAMDAEGDLKNRVNASLEEGLIHNSAGGRALRFLPPLIVTDAEIDEGLERLGRSFHRDH